MRKSNVSVIIVSYNTREQTLRSVESVIEQLQPGDEVVVVDNNSRDGTRDAIEARDYPEFVRVLPMVSNIGFASAVNAGVRLSSAQYILLVNPDAELLSGAVNFILEFAELHPSHGLYGGRTRNRDLSINPSSCWGRPSLWSAVTFACGLSTAFPKSRFWNPESLGRWDRGDVREVPVITGCFLLVDRAAWSDLGGMDETFFLYGEDADFSARAWSAGYRPIVVPAAECIHEGGGSSPASGRKMAMILAGRTTYARLHSRSTAAIAITWLLILGVALRAAPARFGVSRAEPWRDADALRRFWARGYPRALSLFPDSIELKARCGGESDFRVGGA